MASKDNEYSIFDEKLKKYEDKVIEFLKERGKTQNRSIIILAISGYLLMHGELTQKQLKLLSGFSLGSISTNLNAMLGTGMIERKLIKGSTTCCYSFCGNFSEMVEKSFNLSANSILNLLKFLQIKKREIIKYQNKDESIILLKRMEEIESFLKKYQLIMMKYKELWANTH